MRAGRLLLALALLAPALPAGAAPAAAVRGPALPIGTDLDAAAIAAASWAEAQDAPAGQVAASSSDARRVPTQDAIVSRFHDFCGDATGPGLDLGQVELLDDLSSTTGLAWRACAGTEIDTSGATSLVAFYLDEQLVPSHVVVHDLSGPWRFARTEGSLDEADWVVLDSGSVVPRQDPAAAAVQFVPENEFPVVASLEVLVVRAGVVIDAVPEEGLPYPSTPNGCDSTIVPLSDRPHVVATRAGTTAGVAARLRSAGYRVDAVGAQGLRMWPAPTHVEDVLALPGVRSVAPTTLLAPTADVTDDPFGNPWAQSLLRLPEAWEDVASAEAIVAVVDTGVAPTPVDLAGRVLPGIDAVRGLVLPEGRSSALGDHGTQVAALVAATNDDGRDVAGVNDAAQVLPVLVFDHAGCADDVSVAAGIDAAVDAGADVVNLSLGGPGASDVLRRSVVRAIAAGTVVVAATGNAGPSAAPSFPAAYPGVIGVGATDAFGDPTSYSQDAALDVAAPGGTTTLPLRSYGRDGTVTPVVGTSFAAPLVAGIVSLVPDAAPADVLDALLATAGPEGVVDAAAFLAAVDRGQPVVLPEVVDHGPTCAPFVAVGVAYPDVTGPFVEHVTCIGGAGIGLGFPDGTYRPATGLTRGQTAAFVVRLLDAAQRPLPPALLVPDAYPDDDGTGFEDDLNRLATLLEEPEDAARSDEPVSRAVMAEWVGAALVSRGARVEDGVDWFRDDEQDPRAVWIDRLGSLGVVQGVGDGTYGPDDQLTRGQMAVFLARALTVLTEG